MKQGKSATRTIHDEFREKAELAFVYAEDGAFRSAARHFEEIAKEYNRRADDRVAFIQKEVR